MIGEFIEQRGLIQRAAAELRGVDPSKVSRILHGRHADYSTERLIGFLRPLGRDIDIVIRSPGGAGDRAGSASSPDSTRCTRFLL